MIIKNILSNLKMSNNNNINQYQNNDQSSTNPMTTQKNENIQPRPKIGDNPLDKTGIIEVYKENFKQEIKNLSGLLDEYNYIGMDTEFPGTVYSIKNMTEDFYYKSLKTNVDNLKLIQLGITIMNEKGEYPKNYPYHTWQFNLEFDKNVDKFHPSSINLLKQSGIDFEKLKKRGINHQEFAEYLTTSNLVLNPEIVWISFQGSYDFGYLLKLLHGLELPEKEEDFVDLLNTYFLKYYDIRMLVKGYQNMQGGLNRLAEQLNVQRMGMIHQAGSDSMLTLDVFFKLKQGGYINESKLQELKNILHGIGDGRDNDETINYTQIASNNYQNNNNNNIMNVNMTPINTNFWNVNMNYYNYPIMINGQNA
jgi:CCR4-NOT transcription complex subunit 7/8